MNSKLWRIFPVVLLIAAVGIGLLVNLTQWQAIDVIHVTPRILVQMHSETYTAFVFRRMTGELDHFRNGTFSEKDGVSILHGALSEESSNLFDQFTADVSEGKAARVVIVEYTAEGDPIFKYVLFDGNRFLAVVDTPSAGLAGGNEDEIRLRYDYLAIIDHPETGSRFVVLTDDQDLTFEALRDAQIASDMQRIHSYQLFSYSD